MKDVVTYGGKVQLPPYYSRRIATDEPEKNEQAFGNARLRIISGEIGACDEDEISTSNTRNRQFSAASEDSFVERECAEFQELRHM